MDKSSTELLLTLEGQEESVSPTGHSSGLSAPAGKLRR